MDKIIESFMNKVNGLCEMDENSFLKVAKKAEELNSLLTEIKRKRTTFWDLVEDSLSFLQEIIALKDPSVVSSAFQSLYSACSLICGTYSNPVSSIRDLSRCDFKKNTFAECDGKEHLAEEIVIGFRNQEKWNTWENSVIELSQNGYKVYVIISSDNVKKEKKSDRLEVYYIGTHANLQTLFNLAMYITNNTYFAFVIDQLPLKKHLDMACEIIQEDEEMPFVNFMDSRDFSGRLFMKCNGGSISGVYRKRIVSSIGTLDTCFSSEKYLAEDYCIRAEMAGYTYGALSTPMALNVEFETSARPIRREFDIYMRKHGRKIETSPDIQLIGHIFTNIQNMAPEQIMLCDIADEKTTDILIELLCKYCPDITVCVSDNSMKNGKFDINKSICIIYMTPIGKKRKIEDELLDILNTYSVSGVVLYDENYFSGNHLEDVLSDKAGDNGSCVLFTIYHRKNLRNLIETHGYTSTLTRISVKAQESIRKGLVEMFPENGDAIKRNIDTKYFLYTFSKEGMKI